MGSGGLRACRVRDGVRVKDTVKREARQGWGELGWWRGVSGPGKAVLRWILTPLHDSGGARSWKCRHVVGVKNGVK